MIQRRYQQVDLLPSPLCLLPETLMLLGYKAHVYLCLVAYSNDYVFFFLLLSDVLYSYKTLQCCVGTLLVFL